MNLFSGRVNQVIVQGEEDHEGQEEAEGGEEVPDVVVVVEVEQLALGVEVPGLGGGEDPAGGLGHEEVERPGPGHQRHHDVEDGLDQDPLAVAQLHQQVEQRVQQQVADQNTEEETGKIPINCRHHLHLKMTKS